MSPAKTGITSLLSPKAVKLKDPIHRPSKELLIPPRMATWVLVKGFNLSYNDKDTILFTMDPDYGNLMEALTDPVEGTLMNPYIIKL